LERNLENIQKSLIIRILSGIIGGVIFLSIVLIGGLVFKISIILLAILGLIEYFNLMKKIGFMPFRFLTILASIILISFSSNTKFFEITFITFVSLFIIFVLSIPFYYNSGRRIEDGAISIYGFLYLSIPSALFVNLRDISIYHVIYVIAITWTNDIFAFFIGKFFGRHKLAVNISPNKTIEGLLGGIIFSVMLSILFSILFKFSMLKYIFFSIILSISGTIGDLVESVIKREANVKDSGYFLPGHGGFLDRVDSLILNIPIYFILIHLW
jgi:phosphatidate cytidylyltransferase